MFSREKAIGAENDGMHSIKDTYIEVPLATETSWYEFAYEFSNWDGRTWSVE